MTATPTGTTTPSSESEAKHNKEVVFQLLGCRIHCTMSDGRTATGRFVCIDRMKNIILADCVERRSISSSDYTNDSTSSNTTTKTVIRRLQQAMLPGRHIAKVEIAATVYHQKIGGGGLALNSQDKSES